MHPYNFRAKRKPRCAPVVVGFRDVVDLSIWDRSTYNSGAIDLQFFQCLSFGTFFVERI